MLVWRARTELFFEIRYVAIQVPEELPQEADDLQARRWDDDRGSVPAMMRSAHQGSRAAPKRVRLGTSWPPCLFFKESSVRDQHAGPPLAATFPDSHVGEASGVKPLCFSG